jgi:hypothetical protein
MMDVAGFPPFRCQGNVLVIVESSPSAGEITLNELLAWRTGLDQGDAGSTERAFLR